MTVKAFSYFRFSSAPQAEGDSLRRQLSAALEWAAEHPDVELDTSLRDLGVSAFRGEHRIKGALASFLSRIKNGDIPKGSYFLIEGFDRLSRESESVAINLLTGITIAGVKVVTLTDGAVFDDKSDAMDLMRAIIVMSRAHEENKAKSKKLAAAWEDKKRRARETGEILSRYGPAWMRFNEKTKRFDLIPERATIVRRMFQDAIDGLGTTAIAARFNEEDIEPFGRADGWHANYILTILRGPACIGFYQPKHFTKGADRTARRTPDGDPIPNYFPAAVSEETFYRVQSIIDERNRRGKGRGRRGKTFPNLLIGLSRCEECGGRLGIHNTGRSFGNKLTLSCNDAARKHNCTNRHKYDCREIERDLLTFLAKARLERAEAAPDQSEFQFKLDLIADVKRKVEALIDQVEAGVPFVAERLRQRQAELVKLEREAEMLKHAVMSKGSTSPSFLDAIIGVTTDLARTHDQASLYAVRAKLNALLVERFDWVMPLVDGCYVGSGTDCWRHFNEGIQVWFEIPTQTPINREAIDRVYNKRPRVSVCPAKWEEKFSPMPEAGSTVTITEYELVASPAKSAPKTARGKGRAPGKASPRKR